MSDLVDPTQIEETVGAKRHPTRHLGRAVSSTQTVYILHSALCRANNPDLRECTYSRALDNGIDVDVWHGWEDRPVVLGLARAGLVPLRGAS